MSSILIIDDEWKGQQGLYTHSVDFRDHKLTGFASVYDALPYLEALPDEELPDTCVIDTLAKLDFVVMVDDRAGLKAAEMLQGLLKSRGREGTRFLFKSADFKFADKAAQIFKILSPDAASGVVSRGDGDLHYRIRPNGYTPPAVPQLLKEFLAAGAATHPMFTYDELRDRLPFLHQVWDELDEIKNAEGKAYTGFSVGIGRAKTGPIIFSLDDLATLQKTEKAILVCAVPPADLFRNAGRISALVMTDPTDIPGHLRLLLKPHGISLLAGLQGELPALEKLQKVTVDTKLGRLYPEALQIVTPDASAPRLKGYIEDMEASAKSKLGQISSCVPQFAINVSIDEDRRTVSREIPVGLTRTEHHLGPLANPAAWGKLRDFLIGEDAISLRTLFARVGETHGHLAVVARRKEAYDRKYMHIAPMAGCVSGYDIDSVIRLLDIPPEEFFTAPELEKFESLYGKGTRGVQLARKLPELYLKQLRPLAGNGRFRDNGLPCLLIPAVKCADDVEFVWNCVEKALGVVYPMSEISLGAMIETHEACIDIEAIATRVSLISIGSNDLTAAVHNVSRQDPKAAHLFTTLTPEVMTLTGDVVARAREANPNIKVSLCGEAAANPHTLEALYRAGIWIDTFSVPPTYRDTTLLPLVYKDMILQNFCGPWREPDERFFLANRIAHLV